MKTIFDLYKYSINKYSSKLLFRTNKSEYTYKNLETSVNKYKYLMKEYGVKKGDNIIYIGNNSIDWSAVHFACYPLGLKFIPIYKNQHKNVIDYILTETSPKLVFAENSENLNFNKENIINFYNMQISWKRKIIDEYKLKYKLKFTDNPSKYDFFNLIKIMKLDDLITIGW